MKKLLIIAAAAVALALGIIATASAFHGHFTLTTTGCGSCHRAHTALGPQLIKDATIYDLCYSCHGGSGSHATDRNPWTGIDVSINPPARLNGGILGQGSTSRHDVKGNVIDGTASTGAGNAWGGTQMGKGIWGTLECVSCHNPHGSTNYRYLRDSHNGSDEAAGDFYTYLSPFNQFGDPTGTDFSLPFQDNQVVLTDNAVGSTGTPSTRTAGDYANYTKGMRDFCASCHKSYLTKAGSGRHDSEGFGPGYSDGTTVDQYYYYSGTQDITPVGSTGPEKAVYRHATSINFAGQDPGSEAEVRLRFAATTAGATDRTEFVCTTCHFAHGTSYGYGYSRSGSYNPGVGPTGDTALVYGGLPTTTAAGRYVCIACHQRANLQH